MHNGCFSYETQTPEGNRELETARMFVPTTFHAALLMTIISTICWGSFANTFKGTKNYRFELYYWDYGLGIFLISLLLAFTMGSHAGGPNAFLANLHAADNINLFYAALGGFIFNIANVLLIAGIEIVGLAIAFPISIGIALVEGVVLSYALQPRGNPALLAAGVLMAVVAVILVGKAYGALRTGGSCRFAARSRGLRHLWPADGDIRAVCHTRYDTRQQRLRHIRPRSFLRSARLSAASSSTPS